MGNKPLAHYGAILGTNGDNIGVMLETCTWYSAFGSTKICLINCKRNKDRILAANIGPINVSNKLPKL